LAAAFALDGERVLLVDADPQGSALDWSAMRQANPLFPVVGIPKASLHKDLPSIATDYDTVVIDGPPRVNELARSALLAADLVVVPVQPSPYDVWAAEEILKLLREASLFKEKLKSVFVVNRRIVNTAIGRDVAEALRNYGIPVLSASLCQRVAFAESAGQGLTVLETEPNGTASREVRALAKELRAL
jgi:chromosome partitioning protein